MKPDERALLLRLLAIHGENAYAHRRPMADAVGEEIGIPPKRTEYLLQKWTDRGWWEYGVSARTGWFTPEGIQHLQGVLVAS